MIDEREAVGSRAELATEVVEFAVAGQFLEPLVAMAPLTGLFVVVVTAPALPFFPPALVLASVLSLFCSPCATPVHSSGIAAIFSGQVFKLGPGEPRGSI